MQEIQLSKNDLEKVVNILYPEFDRWWRNKYHYFTLDPIGAVQLWGEFLIDTGRVELYTRLLEVEKVKERWKQ